MPLIYEKSIFEEFDTDNLLIVFDTNVLLDLYRLPQDALEEIIDKFNENEDLFWIPNQVNLEFIRNSEEKKKRQLELCSHIKAQINDDISCMQDKVTKLLCNEGKYKSYKFQELTKILKQSLDNVKKNIKEPLKQIDKELREESVCISNDNDIIYRFVEDIKAEEGFTQLELIDIYEEGEKRYKYKISPGFTDIDKNDENQTDKYGDLIIWKEILRKVKGSKCKLVFVENEKKEDWWEGRTKTQIPKVLKEEFINATLDGSQFYMMDFEEFLNHFAKVLNISGASIQSINNISRFRKRADVYLYENLKDLLKYYVEEYGQDGLIYHIEQTLLGECARAGTIDYVDDIDITDINTLSANLDIDYYKDFITYIINGKIEVINSGNATEYISREYSDNCNFIAKNKVDVELFLNMSIDEDDIRNVKDIQDILEVEGLHFNNIKNVIIESEFSDDDYYEGGHYSICPDCGDSFGVEKDGGNGFCIDCALKH